MKSGFIFLIILIFCTAASAQEKGIIVKSDKGRDTAAIDFDRRIALIIGNNKYTHSPLNNPVNDALAMAEVLSRYGFMVILDTNIDRARTNRLINQFGDSISRKKGVSFFFYSGHGVQYNMQNFMLPLHADLERETDISDEAVALNKVFDKLNQTGNGLNIVILDACRSNIFLEKMPQLQKGLTDQEGPPSNTYVFYATSPGNVALDGTGKNSPFTEALLDGIQDDVEFFQVVKKVNREVKNKTGRIQQPTITGSPEDDFIFTAGKKDPLTQPSRSGKLNFNFEKLASVVRNLQGGSTLHVLSIGISAYRNELPPILFGASDAKLIAGSLEKMSGLFYDSVETHILIDNQATAFNIYTKFNNILKKAKGGDLIVMYFGGHNVYDSLSSGSYFAAFDALGMEPAFHQIGWIEYEKVRQFLANAPCKSLLLLDGGFVLSSVSDLVEIDNGVMVLASTQPDGLVYESMSIQGGYFVNAIAKGLAGFADTDSSGYVNFNELSRYVEYEVSKNTLRRQRPTAYYHNTLRNFKLARTDQDLMKTITELLKANNKMIIGER